jgi:hypothetical protein
MASLNNDAASGAIDALALLSGQTWNGGPMPTVDRLRKTLGALADRANAHMLTGPTSTHVNDLLDRVQYQVTDDADGGRTLVWRIRPEGVNADA